MKRTESEMIMLIRRFVKKHSEIEAVGTEGSRNNPNIVPDEFQDFDITFFVSQPSQLIKFRNLNYENEFGEIVISQSPRGTFEDDYGVVKMMQFTDGNRIDLKIRLLSSLSDYLNEDSLNRIGDDRKTSDLTWRVKSPKQDELLDCVNEFYWVATYVAKGIKRNQLIYANTTFELIRKEYFRLLSWQYFTGENPGKFYANISKVSSIEKFYKLGTLDNTKEALIEILCAFKKELTVVPEYVEKTEKYIFCLLNL